MRLRVSKFVPVVITLFVWTYGCCGASDVPVTQNPCFSAIRMISGNTVVSTLGRVELQNCDGAWGTVCPRDWPVNEVQNNVDTICAMMGFSFGGTIIPNTFGAGNRNYVIGNMTCPLDALSVTECTQSFVKTCTAQDEELAITCNYDTNGRNYVNLTNSRYDQTSTFFSSGTITSVPIGGNCKTNSSFVSLLSSSDPEMQALGNGLVRISVGNGWSFISAQYWDQADATVLCRQLCYTNTSGFTALPGIIANSVPTQTNPIIQTQGFDCNGTESRLEDCPRIGASTTPPGTALAGVQCLPDCEECKVILPRVTCTSDNLLSFFSAADFNVVITAHDILASNKYLPNCVNITSNSSGTLVTISLSSTCGTQLKENTTHLTFSNQIRISLVKGSSSYIANGYIDNMYYLACAVPKTYAVMTRYQGYMVQRNATLSDQFNYSISIDLYENCNFTSSCPSIGGMYLVEVGQWLDAAITLNNYDNRTELAITDCDGYPVTPYSSYTPVVSLIKNRCPVESTTTMYNLDKHRQGFQVKAFTFIGYSTVYITCTVTVCVTGSSISNCDRTCGASGRRRRQAGATPPAPKTATVSSDQILIYEKSSGMQALLNAVKGGGNSEIKIGGSESTAGQQTSSTSRPQVEETTKTKPEQQQGIKGNAAELYSEGMLKEYAIYNNMFDNSASQFSFSAAIRVVSLVLAVGVTRMLK